MNTRLASWAIGVAVLAMALPAQAQLAGEVSGKTDVGVIMYWGEYENAKFNEYLYNPHSSIRPYVSAEIAAENAQGNHYYDALLNVRAEEDIDLNFETGSYGVYKFDAGVTRMRHNFAFDASSLFSGNGTGSLTVDDAVSDAMFAVQYNNASKVSKLRGFVDSGEKVDLSLHRDNFRTSFEWQSIKDLALKLDFNDEIRKGSRPFAIYMSGTGWEIPEPIDHNTMNLSFGAEYTGKPVFASLKYTRSAFNNANSGVLVESPLFTNGTSTQTALGRMSLAPDNTYDGVDLELSKPLGFLHSKVSAQASYGMMRQNDEFVAMTANIATATIALPADSLAGKIDKTNLNLEWEASPMEKLHVKAGYGYHQHANKTSELTFSEYIAYDTSRSTTPISTGYVSYIKRVGELEASYELDPYSNVSFLYENEGAGYVNGSANRESINLYHLAYDTRRWEKVFGKVVLEHSNKNSDYPDYTQDLMELPWMRKFYAASRLRNKALMMATVMPFEDVTFNLEYSYAGDNYDESSFGLLRGEQNTAVVDMDYDITEDVTLNASYTYDNYVWRQQSRGWTIASTNLNNPYSSSYSDEDSVANWTLKVRDYSYSPELGIEVRNVIKDRLDFKASASYTKIDGTGDFESEVGTGSNDSNAFDPQDWEDFEDSKRISVKSKFDYHVSEIFSLALGYEYESWKIDDFNYAGYDEYEDVVTNGSGTYSGLVTMDTLPKSYNVQGVYVTASYRF